MSNESRAEAQLSDRVRAGLFAGVLALAAITYFLFKRYWLSFPTALQTALLITGSISTFVATFCVARRDTTGHLTRWAAVLSFACFVANIALFRSMFNITPTAVPLIAWSALALLLSRTFNSKLLFSAGVLCVIALLITRLEPSGSYYYWVDRRLEILFAVAFLLFAIPLGLPHAGLRRSAAILWPLTLVTMAIAILVLADSGAPSYLRLAPDSVARLYQLFGMVLSAVAIWYGVRRSRYGVINVSLVYCALVVGTVFYDPGRSTPKTLYYFAFALGGVLFVLITNTLRTRSRVAKGNA